MEKDLMLTDEEMYSPENKTSGGFLDLTKVRQAQLAKVLRLQSQGKLREKIVKIIDKAIVEAMEACPDIIGIEPYADQIIDLITPAIKAEAFKEWSEAQIKAEQLIKAEARAEGIKEVVEWIQNDSYLVDQIATILGDIPIFLCHSERWQQKLKEWENSGKLPKGD